MLLAKNSNGPTIRDYYNLIDNSNIRRKVYKVEFVEKTDETPYATMEDDIVNASGSLNISISDGVRRTCSFTLKNNDDKYTELFSNLSIGSKFKLYLGYIINDIPYYFPEGVFVFDSPSLVSSLSDNTITISGTDKWSMLNGTNGGILESTYVIEKGDILKNVIERTIVLDICGDSISPIIDNSIANNEIPYDIERAAGSSMGDILLEIAITSNANIYYDENGRLVVKPIEYDAIKGTLHHFVYGQDINYISSTKTLDYTNIFNGTFVEADNSQTDDVPIVAYARNNSLIDPNSIPNIGFIKWKQISEYITGIDTQQKADERVEYELKKVASNCSVLSIECIPMYHIIENSIITITDLKIGANEERFLVNSMTIPISIDGTMTIGCSKAMGYI